MTRTRAALTGIGVAALLALLFFALFERVEEEVDLPFGTKARRNPLLAAERLAERFGVPARTVVRLEEPPSTGDVVVFADDRRLRTQGEATRLIEWVARGGRAIVVVPPFGGDESPDPILHALDVSVHDAERLWFGYLRLVLPEDPTPVFVRWHGGARIQVPKGTEAIEADLLSARRDAEASEEQQRKVEELLARLRRDRDGEKDAEDPKPAAASPFPVPNEVVDGVTPIARIALGKGSVVVTADLDFLRNGSIGELDHARAAWGLIAWGGKPTGLLFVHGTAEPHFFATVAAAVWPGLAGFATLLLALAWRSGRRFGPAEPEPALVRRRLMEHVEATGRFHWRRGDVETVLAGARRAVAARLQRRRPHLAEQPLERRVAALAELASLSPADVEHALTPGAPGGPEGFTRCVRTLEAIRRQL